MALLSAYWDMASLSSSVRKKKGQQVSGGGGVVPFFFVEVQAHSFTKPLALL